MTIKQLALAVKIAQGPCPPADDTILHGICTPQFKLPVYATIETVAIFIRYHCLQFNGGWDNEGFNDIAHALKRKVLIVG